MAGLSLLTTSNFAREQLQRSSYLVAEIRTGTAAASAAHPWWCAKGRRHATARARRRGPWQAPQAGAPRRAHRGARTARSKVTSSASIGPGGFRRRRGVVLSSFGRDDRFVQARPPRVGQQIPAYPSGLIYLPCRRQRSRRNKAKSVVFRTNRLQAFTPAEPNASHNGTEISGFSAGDTAAVAN